MENNQASVSALLARIDALESHESIRALAFDYCHGFDKRDYDRFLTILSEDCVCDIGPPFGRFETHEGIHEAIYDVLWSAWRETHHLTSNNRITLLDPDHATSVCDVGCMGTLNSEDTCQVAGARHSAGSSGGGLSHGFQ